MGGTEFEFKRKLQTIFAKVKTEKPDASRKQSTEGFFVGVGYKPIAKRKPKNEENFVNEETVINEEPVVNEEIAVNEEKVVKE
jgi:hypothetical protein